MLRKVKIGQVGLMICLIGLIGLVGCNADRECRQDTGISMNVIFSGDSLRASTDSARLALDSLACDTVWFSTVSGMRLHGVGIDSLLMDGSATSLARLPLRPDTTFSDFVVDYNGRSDTMRIRHLNDMRFISLACGCIVYHTIEGVDFTSDVIDSVEILNSAVTTSSSDKHIRIFFHKE